MFFVIAIVAFVASVVHVGRRRFWVKDEIYAGVTPGLEPPPGGPARVEPTRGMEYKGTIAVAFQPPRTLTPGLIGLVVDGTVDPRDLTASIIDLAARGYFTLEVVDPNLMGAGTKPKKDWLVRGLEKDPAGLMEYEQLLLKLIPAGKSARMSQLVRYKKDALAAVAESMRRQAVQLGWYRESQPPSADKGRHRIAYGGSSLIAAFLSLGMSATPLGWATAGLFLGAGGVIAFDPGYRPPRTAAGSAVRIQSLGFKRYLETAEANQIRYEEASAVFSRYLPYAIVFGVAEHWAKVFKDVAVNAEADGIALGFDLGWFVAVDLADSLLDTLILSDGVDLLVDGMGEFLGSFDGLGDFIGDGIGEIFDFFDF